MPDELQSETRLLSIPFVTGRQSLASASQEPRRGFGVGHRQHVQLVLSDRTVLSEGRDFGVLSPLTWRLRISSEARLLKAGLGWGHMPLHMVKADLESGVLVDIRVEAVPRAVLMPMSVVFRKDAPPGPAGRLSSAQLKRK